MESKQHQQCFHCLEPIPKFTNINASIDGQQRAVCCHGCKAAAEYISDKHFTEFYQRRAKSTIENHVGTKISDNRIIQDWSFLDQLPESADYVRDMENGCRVISIYVQGVYCSSCSWLINKSLANLSDQITARMDSDSKRLWLEIADPEIAISDILITIEKIGYQPSPILLNAPQTDAQDRLKHEHREALKRIAVAGFGMMQVMTYAFSIYFGDYQGMDEAFRRFLSLTSLLVATAVVFYAGKPFFANAWNDLKHRHLGMDVPIALAIGGAYFPSVYQTLIRDPLHLPGDIYFDSAVMFVFFLSVGRFIEMRARQTLNTTPAALSRLLPPSIEIIRVCEGVAGPMRISPDQTRCGDRIQLSDHQILPFDGLIIRGKAMLDESTISGESLPVERHQGERVIAGSTLLSGELEVEASVPWSESSMVRIERLLRSAQLSSDEQSKVIKNVAQYFVTAVLIITVLVAISWWFIDPDRVFNIVLAMLVASCPCAFSLAAPIGVTAASHALRAVGILLANFKVMELIPQITTWCFDKTGTITRGRPAIVKAHTFSELDVKDCLDLASAIERQNNHILSLAFAKIDSELCVQNLQQYAGNGVGAKINGQQYYLGKPSWVLQQITNEGADSHTIKQDLQKHSNYSVVAIATQDAYLAHFFITDPLRSQAKSALTELRALGKSIHILSGDRLSAVRATTAVLEVDTIAGDLLPEQKMQSVQKLQSRGEIVAMLGDGVNDAPVIAQANVSVAMSNGSELSHAQADIIVLNGQLGGLKSLHKIAVKTKRIAQQNMFWAVVYNFIAIPLAATGLLTPWLAALGMSASSLLVVLNALRITKTR